MTGVGMIPPAILLIITGYVDCTNAVWAIVLLTLAQVRLCTLQYCMVDYSKASSSLVTRTAPTANAVWAIVLLTLAQVKPENYLHFYYLH